MAKRMMKAVQYDKHGGGAAALKHVEVPVPTPGKGEVLLKVEATCINPVDWKIQKGKIPFHPRKFPFIPCTDVAGEVVEIGPNVNKFKPGDKVVAILNLATGGGMAEYCVAKETQTASRPEEVSASDGACLPIACLTAHIALTQTAGLKLDGTGPCKNILITAASGGVGHYAVQLAKLGNAHVTATCGGRNVELVKSLGADEVIDYKTSDGAALKSPSGKKYDVILHCGPYTPWSVFEPNLTKNGVVIDITPASGSILTFVMRKLCFCKKRLVLLMLSPKVENLEFVLELMKEGKLKTVIDSRHPLSKGEVAWKTSLEGHATGKIVVEVEQ